MTRRTRHSRSSNARTGTARVAVVACALLVAGQLATLSPAAAAPPAPSRAATFVDLGSAAAYSVLGGTGVTNTGAATALALNLGLSPSGAIAGFPPGTVTGTIHDKDAAAAQAQADRQDAYDAAAAQTGGTAFAGDQAGTTFKPGVHTSGAAITNTGTMTLDADGDPSAVFVFQIGAALSSAAASKVVLSDGALANNVYWQVLGAVSFGAGATSVGTFLGAAAVTFGEGASLKGRVLTPSTVGLANSPVTPPIDDLTAPVVTLDGGSARATNDTTPTISGTTDEPLGRPVTVTVGEQTLTTTVGEDGVWAVGATALAEGPYEVVATITDASQNTGTANQVLTVDVTAPVVSVDGGATRSTKDRTPSITGTTDEPEDTPVTVTVGGQTLTSTVYPDGAWSVDVATLPETTHGVVVSVDDAAGNTGTANQILTVDVTVPVVTIDGGDTRSTNDTSPWTYGTTAEKAGTIVHVTVGGQALTATVHPGGTWGVSAATLPEATHRVVASITDAAGNRGSARQTLTIGDPGPGDPGPRYLPDASVRKRGGDFVGVGAYGASGQTVTRQLRGGNRTAVFEVRVTNRGNAADRMKVRGAPGGSKLRVTYTAGGEDVTRAVKAGTYRTRELASGESVRVVLRVTRTAGAGPGVRRTFEVRATSSHAQDRRDTVAAVVQVLRATARPAGIGTWRWGSGPRSR